MTLPDLEPGPVAVVINEDDVEIASTIAHLRSIGFSNIVVSGETKESIGETPIISHNDLRLSGILNPLLKTWEKRWVYWCYNAEYLYFPFCEDRSILDAAQFITEERRSSVLSCVVDLYAGDLAKTPSGIDLDVPCFDRAGTIPKRATPVLQPSTGKFISMAG